MRLSVAACLTVLVAAGCGSDDEPESPGFPVSQAPDGNEPDENEDEPGENGNEPDEQESDGS